MAALLCVRSYKMETDSGFAPNPYGGLLTLATCKPGIRRVAACDEWVAGFTSKKMNGDPVGEERLVFLMRVAGKLRREIYYAWFPQKRPDQCTCGDNIYRPNNDGTYRHLGGPCHKGKAEQDDDHKSSWVLLADEFYYFGGKPLSIDKAARPNVPERQINFGRITEDEKAARFIDFVKNQATKLYPGKSGKFNEPHSPCDPDCPGGR